MDTAKKKRLRKVAIASTLIFFALFFMFRDDVLDRAVQRHSLFLTKLMLTLGADRNFRDDGEPILNYAASEHDLKIVQVLIARGAKIDQSGDLGETPLMCAINMNDFETASYLVSRGAKLSLRNSHGQTAASLALASTDARIRRLAKS